MSKRTVRANAQTLPEATPHPDAAIFALAKKCKESRERRDKLIDACNAAEDEHRVIETPRAVYKTEADAKMQLFTGGGIGNVYSAPEIACIRGRCQGLAKRIDLSSEMRTIYVRGIEILRAWGYWRAEVDAEEARTGLAEVQRASVQASDEGEHLAERMARLPVSTLEGLLAKAAALQEYLPPIEGISDRIREDMLLYGVDEEALALSLARDVLALAQGTEART